MPRLTAAEIRKFKDGQGNYLIKDFSADFAFGRLLNYEIVADEGMPAIDANAFGIAFGDMKQAYQIFDHKVGMRVTRAVILE